MTGARLYELPSRRPQVFGSVAETEFFVQFIEEMVAKTWGRFPQALGLAPQDFYGEDRNAVRVVAFGWTEANE